MDLESLNRLISKYLDGTASTEETEQVNAWYNSFDGLDDHSVPGSPELAELTRKNFEQLKTKLGFG